MPTTEQATDDARKRHEQTKRVASEPLTAAEARAWFAELAAIADDSRTRQEARS